MRAALVVAVLAQAASAQARPIEKGAFGIGLVLGEPTGISAKLYFKDDQALQASLGGVFINTGYIFDLDYLFHPWILTEKDEFVLPVYLGPGVRFVDYQAGGASYFAPGLRAVIGLLFDFKKAPLDTFVEAGPAIEYRFGGHGGTSAAFSGGIGLRYYF